MFTLLSFILAISVLVFVHEGGHFLAARLCGVKVKRFSVGLGKPFFMFKDRRGTEWALGWIPLGGYVSMLDGRGEEVAPGDMNKTFHSKPWSQKVFILAAGAMANFLLAWFLYSAVFSIPREVFKPVLGPVYENSIAKLAGFKEGDLVIHANDRKIETIEDWQEALVVWSVSIYQNLPVKVITKEGKEETRVLPVLREPLNPSEGWTKALGWAHLGDLNGPPNLMKLTKDGPFEKSGMKEGDLIKEIDGQPISNWSELVRAITSRPGKKIVVNFERDGQVFSKEVQLATKTINQTDLGMAGVQTPLPTLDKKIVWLSAGEASFEGARKTWMITKMTIDGMVRMVAGYGSADQVSGPLGIAEHAGKSAENGLANFCLFMALLSVSLGVLNLLPIPLLDGGQIVMLTIEKVYGKPIHPDWERAAISFGFFLIISLTVIGLLNDARKLFGI